LPHCLCPPGIGRRVRPTKEKEGDRMEFKNSEKFFAWLQEGGVNR